MERGKVGVAEGNGSGGGGLLSLYLLRHGETEFSRQDRFCGRFDAPLTVTGRWMAACFAKAYSALPWKQVLTSTRVRAVETALPLAARAGVSIQSDPRLDEMAYGRWQGLSKRDVALRDPERFARWCRDPAIGPPAGEAPLDVAARAGAVVDELTQRFINQGEGGPVLIVSHKTVLRLLLCKLLGVEIRRYRDLTDWPVAAVSVLDIGPGGVHARQLADVAHLDAQPVSPPFAEVGAAAGYP
jgi:probable phosphoglycerate mutase